MLAVVIGLILILAVAGGIVALVAAPRLREGDELLTAEGKQRLANAGHQAREQSAAAAENTVQAVSSIKSKVSQKWAPASEYLHGQFDRLEGTGPQPVIGPDGQPVENDHGATVSGRGAGVAGGPVIGGPRPVPIESGPIPLDERNTGADAPSDTEDAVINLREPGHHESRPRPRIH